MTIGEFRSDPEMSQGIQHPLVCCTSRIDRHFSHPHIRASSLTVAIRGCVLSSPSFIYIQNELRSHLPPHTGMTKHATAAKVAGFTCALDIAQTKTERTALITNADEIRGEEERLAKVRHFLTFSRLFWSFPKHSDRKLTCIHSFTGNQRNSRLWHQSHHPQLLHQRLSPAVS
jgi:hypothetical protein